MKIISYNVNGIRAAIRKGITNWIKIVNPDIICFQEIKASIVQINTEIFQDMGYYHYWFPAEKLGYSGVGILSKIKPINIVYGIGINEIDQEGRIIRLDFQKYSIINIYIPSGSDMNKRLAFKLKFMDIFFMYIQNIKNKYPNLIISGDYNISHQNIDIHDPINNKNLSGFLNIERNWMTKFIKSGFIDTFRYLFKEVRSYTWWNYRYQSRMKNNGWRIDYHIISKCMLKTLENSMILSDINHSDHCPILLEMNI